MTPSRAPPLMAFVMTISLKKKLLHKGIFIMEENNSTTTVMDSLVPLIMGYCNNSSPIGPIGPVMDTIFKYFDLNAVSFHKKEALLTTFGFIAAHLNENITLILSEQQGVNGMSLLNTIGNIIPGSFKTEFSDLNKQFLICNSEALKNKAVVAYTPGALKKNGDLLRNLVERGIVKDQVFNKAGSTKQFTEIDIMGPTSIIVLVGKTEPRWLNEFSALRLNLDSNPDFVTEQLNMRRSRPDQDKILFCQKIAEKEIGRLTPQNVNIAFRSSIIDCLDKTRNESIAIIDTICSFLNIISIINNAVFANVKEIKSGFYNFDMSILYDKHCPPLIEHKTNSEVAWINPLEATKVDYYILYSLLEGVVGLNEGQITGNSRLIFDAIKAINSGYIFGSTTLDSKTADEVEFIQALDNQKDGKGWANILEIKDKIKKYDNIEMSDSSIHRGVKDLCERKFVSKRKDPAAPNKFLYSVATLTLNRKFALPKPCTILDPIYEGKNVDVIHPLTGVKEVI